MKEYLLPPIDTQKGDWDEHALNRRQFLLMGFWSVTGAACLVFGGAGMRFFIGHSMSKTDQQWVDLIPIAELSPGQMHRLTYNYHSTDLWREEQRTGVAYAYTPDGKSFTVLEATCSHLGCNVHWKPSNDHFACPCHKGIYSKEGEILEGPPPRPLRRLETRIENSILQAQV